MSNVKEVNFDLITEKYNPDMAFWHHVDDDCFGWSPVSNPVVSAETLSTLKGNLDRAIVLSTLEAERHGFNSFSYRATKIYEDAARKSYMDALADNSGVKMFHDESDVDEAIELMDVAYNRWGQYSAQYDAAVLYFKNVHNEWRERGGRPSPQKKHNDEPVTLSMLQGNLDRAVMLSQKAADEFGYKSAAYDAAKIYEDAARKSYNDALPQDYFDGDIHDSSNEFSIM